MRLDPDRAHEAAEARDRERWRQEIAAMLKGSGPPPPCRPAKPAA